MLNYFFPFEFFKRVMLLKTIPFLMLREFKVNRLSLIINLFAGTANGWVKNSF